MNYKVRRQGIDLGIFSLEELRHRHQLGEFSGAEYVQREDMTDWQPLDFVLESGYRTTPPPLPTLSSPRGPNPIFIVGAIVVSVIVFVAIVIFSARTAFRAQQLTINQRSQRPYNFTPPQPSVPAAKQPVVWTTNSLTVTDANQRAREFRTRQWLDGYQQRGQRNSASDAEAITFLQTWITQNYGGTGITNQLSLAEESDKLANDPHCTDPLVLTIAAINSLNEFDTTHRLERALAAYRGTQHRAYPQFYASLMLAAKSGARSDRAGYLTTAALQLLSTCFTDGSFTPDDQQEIADILVNGWGYDFFQRNAPSICMIVHQAGPDYNWLALTLDGEHEIIAAWAARGGGYADTVTAAGQQGFSSHLATARERLTAAWNLQPRWPLAPERMIYVSLGDADIDEMRVWFDRTTTAQVDYPRAWKDFRWGLRPRWYGNEASLLALGKVAIDTGRFDTDVPRKYIDCIYDVESEMGMSPGRHIFGRADIWPNLQRIYDGYIATPAQAKDRAGWRTSYAVIAYFAQKYDVARTQLEALNWQPVAENLADWNVDLSQMPLEVAARTGSLGKKIARAETLRDNGDAAGALEKYSDLAKATDADARTRQFIQIRLAQLAVEKRLHAGEWVDLLPASDTDPNWVFSFGQTRHLPDGALEVEYGRKGHMLYSQLHVGANFEVRGQIENVRSSSKNFQAGLVMGVPDFGTYNWYGFRLKRHHEESDVVCFAQGWTREQIAQHIVLNDITNSFDFIFQNQQVTASVNGMEVFHQANPPRSIYVPDNSYLLGLGAFSDSADTVVRYRNVQMRRLH